MAKPSRLFVVLALVIAMLSTAMGSTVSGAAPTPGPASKSPAAPPPPSPDEADLSEDLHRGAPARPQPTTFLQPDGSAVVLIPQGDGSRHWHETSAGDSAVRAEDGTWVYANGLDGQGQLVPGTRVVGRDDAPDAAAGLTPTADDPAGRSADATVRGGATRTPNHQHQGAAPTLVILAEFTDQAGSTPATYWNGLIFGGSASVSDYFDVASYGAFDVEPATETSGTADDGIVGWVNLGYDHPNIGGDGWSGPTVIDAIEAANASVDFAAYDTDGNDELAPHELHITVIMAGYETAYDGVGACGPSVWAHQDFLGSEAPVVDTVTAAATGYTTFGERHCETGDDHPATMGVIAHELGHDIDLPDLYDVDGSSAGAGAWTIMAGGSWNNTVDGDPGDLPALLDPFSKSVSGWIDPTEVVTPLENAVIQPAGANDSVYQLLANPAGTDWGFNNGSGSGEYFLVENRQQTGYDAGLPGCGVVVWHIDEGVTSTNGANADDTHRLVDVVEADNNEDDDDGDAGDPWPGSTANADLGAATTPSSDLYDGSDSGASMTVESNDCGSDMVVDLAVASCPPDDAYEPNDAVETATSPDAYPVIGRICPGNDDWYAIAAEAGDEIVIDLAFTHAVGDLWITLWNEASQPVGISNGTTDAEHISYIAPATGTYYIQTSGGGTEIGSYSLNAEIAACPPDDEFEPNDDTATATPFTLGTPVEGQICADNLDYFAVELQAGTFATIDLDFDEIASDLDLFLSDADDNYLTSSESGGFDEHIEYLITETGTYHVSMLGWDGSEGAYTLTITETPSLCTAGQPGPFDDVPEDHPFCDDIEWMARNEIAGGFPDGTYRPGIDITRQAMAAFLYRYSGDIFFEPPVTATFSDVPTTHPFFVEIEWMAFWGIAGGFPDGTYRPGASVTRQATAAFIYRYDLEPEFEPPATATFTDVPTDHPFFLEIEWMADSGIAGGFPDGTYRPTTPVTRQAFAAFLHRYDGLGAAG